MQGARLFSLGHPAFSAEMMKGQSGSFSRNAASFLHTRLGRACGYIVAGEAGDYKK